MQADPILRVLFILYCLEAGALLIWAPWTLVWDRLSHQISSEGLGQVLLTPAFRGGVTGFGLIHLLWGAHDLRQWWRHRRRLKEALEGGTEVHAGEPARNR